MKKKHSFYLAGSARNQANILQICDIFAAATIDHYCFLQNEALHHAIGLDVADPALAEKFQDLPLESGDVRVLFEQDIRALKRATDFLLILPAGKSAHIEAGIAYGLGKKCYAIGKYEATDSLYLIFEEIFATEAELNIFLTTKQASVW